MSPMRHGTEGGGEPRNRSRPGAPPGAEPGSGSGVRIWLFRHGEVHGDWRGLAYGGLDVPLSERGLDDTLEVARLCGRLPFRRVLASSLARARRLGEELARHSGAPLTVDPGLAEIARGSWQGRSVAELHRDAGDEVAAFYADPWNFDEHGGETDRDVHERAWPVLAGALAESAKLAATGDRRPLAVAAHYNVIRVILARALGIRPADSFRLRIDLSAISVLIDGADGFRLERMNVRGPGGLEEDDGPSR